jgi:chromosome segregation ATPase
LKGTYKNDRFAMLSEEQIKKLISANESLQVQLEDANAMLSVREQEIEFLNTELADATALRSKLDGQLDEIESIQNRLGEKQQAVKGAEERELELHQELTEMAILNRQYNELIQDYAYLQSRFNDIQAQLAALHERNFKLQQITSRIGELESTLENTRLERDDLKNRVTTLESQKYLREFNG